MAVPVLAMATVSAPARAVSSSIAWSYFPASQSIYNGNNAHQFTLAAGDCSVVADFRAVNKGFTPFVFLQMWGYGPVTCFDNSRGVHMNVSMEWFDWSDTLGHPWAAGWFPTARGYNEPLPVGSLDPDVVSKHGVTLVKMGLTVNSSDFSVNSQATVPFDTRMCSASTTRPGMSPWDCGVQPNITNNPDGEYIVPAFAAAPAARGDLVSVGSGEMQGFDAAVAAGFNGGGPAAKYVPLAAVGDSPMAFKTDVYPMGRPADSDDGIAALEQNHEVDIARSTRGPQSGDMPGKVYVPFAKDAVGWAAPVGGNAPANLTTADLVGIFQSCTITKWSQITDIPGYVGPATTIKAYLPPKGSDTRDTFIGALGYGGTLGNCLQSATPAENEGTDPVFQNNPDAIFPYSIGHYVAQTYFGRGAGADQPGVLDAKRATNGSQQVDVAAKAIGSPFFGTVFGRSLFHVVRQSDWNDPVRGPRLKALLGGVGVATSLCANDLALIASYGFRTNRVWCGSYVQG